MSSAAFEIFCNSIVIFVNEQIFELLVATLAEEAVERGFLMSAVRLTYLISQDRNCMSKKNEKNRKKMKLLKMKLWLCLKRKFIFVNIEI